MPLPRINNTPHPYRVWGNNAAKTDAVIPQYKVTSVIAIPVILKCSRFPYKDKS